MNFSPINQNTLQNSLRQYSDYFKKTPHRMTYYQSTNCSDNLINSNNQTSPYISKFLYESVANKYSNIKKIPETYSTLRQTFNNFKIKSLKLDQNYDCSNKNTDEFLSNTVDLLYKKPHPQRELSSSAVTNISYKSIFLDDKTQLAQSKKLKQSRLTNYDNLSRKLKRNTDLLKDLKRIKIDNSSKPNQYLYNSYKETSQFKQQNHINKINEIKNKYKQYINHSNEINQYSRSNIQQLVKKKVIKQNLYFNQLNGFVIVKKLGEGKFGTVYLARHKLTQGIFALKKVPKNMINQHKMTKQFIQQVKLQSYFNHQNIVRLYGVFSDLESIYLILQYMEQGTLFSCLKKSKILSEQSAAIKIKDVSQALKYLHENGVAHRDIKPQNVVMSFNVSKICDFGWATRCDERRRTYCGTFDYAPPQILEGVQYDISVDLWCLGILAYELMAGKAPFYHLSRKQTLKNILLVQQKPIKYPQHLSNSAISFIEGLVRKDPQQRMQNSQILNHPFLKINQ